MPNEQETFDIYFTAALTGILANPAIITAVSQLAAINRQEGKKVREDITACAHEYASLAMIARTKRADSFPYSTSH